MFGLGRKNEYRYKVGDVVEYVGSYKSKNGFYEIKKRMYQDSKPCYECISLSKGNKVVFTEGVIEAKAPSKKEKTEKPKNAIQEIDARAKQIQKKSGVKEVKKVVAYNMSLKDAKKIAFREAAAKRKS